MVDTRLAKGESSRKRRRRCEDCGKSFVTEERLFAGLPKVVKQDGRREPFDQGKLQRGIEVAMHKRPVSAEVIGEFVNQIIVELSTKSRSEIKSSEIGDVVMFRLADIDQVAYIRYASVYRHFKDAAQFGEIATHVKGRLPSPDVDREQPLPFTFSDDNEES